MPDDIEAQLAASQERCRKAARDLADATEATPHPDRASWQGAEAIEAERVYAELTIEAAIRRATTR